MLNLTLHVKLVTSELCKNLLLRSCAWFNSMILISSESKCHKPATPSAALINYNQLIIQNQIVN